MSVIKHELSDDVRKIANRVLLPGSMQWVDLHAAADALDSLAAENAKLRGEVLSLRSETEANSETKGKVTNEDAR